MKAKEIVEKTIRDMTPPGVPMSHTRIVSARFESKHHIVGKLEMFDQQNATVDLKRWALGWSIRYSELPGGNVMWTGSRWKRDTVTA